jgi:hypothetical protein
MPLSTSLIKLRSDPFCLSSRLYNHLDPQGAVQGNRQDGVFSVDNMPTNNDQTICTPLSSFPFVPYTQFTLQVNLFTSTHTSWDRARFTSPARLGDIDVFNRLIWLHKALQVRCYRFLNRASLMVSAFLHAALEQCFSGKSFNSA